MGKCDLKHSAPNFSLCFPARFAECWHAYIEPSGNHTRRDTGQRAFCFCTLAFISTRLTQHTAVSPVSSVLRTPTHKKKGTQDTRTPTPTGKLNIRRTRHFLCVVGDENARCPIFQVIEAFPFHFTSAAKTMLCSPEPKTPGSGRVAMAPCASIL